MPIDLTSIDVVIIVICLTLAVALGLWHAKPKSESMVELALAGRRLSLPMFTISLVATWYGAVLSVGEFVWYYGIAVVLCFALPYYVFAVIYALFFARRIRESHATSIPEQFRITYGENAGRISALLVFVLTSPAPYVLMAAQVLSLLLDINFVLAAVGVTTLSLSYAAIGGLRSDARANVIQLAIMFGGFITLFVFSCFQLGSPIEMFAAVPSASKSIPGTIGWMGILGWWVLALQTFVDPNFHQRVSAVTSPKTAQRGLLISVGLWMVFDFLTISTALYATAFTHPSIPMHAHLALANLVLPSVGKGLFVGAILSAILSTLDGYAIVHGVTLSHDILAPLRKKKSTGSDFRNGLVIGGVLAVVLALTISSVIEMFFFIACIALPGLLVPLLVSYTTFHKYLVRNATVRILLPTIIGFTGVVLFPSSTAIVLAISVMISMLMHFVDYYRFKT